MINFFVPLQQNCNQHQVTEYFQGNNPMRLSAPLENLIPEIVLKHQTDTKTLKLLS